MIPRMCRPGQLRRGMRRCTMRSEVMSVTRWGCVVIRRHRIRPWVCRSLRIGHGTGPRGHARWKVLTIRTAAVPTTVGRILEAFAVLFQAERLATFASILVDAVTIPFVLCLGPDEGRTRHGMMGNCWRWAKWRCHEGSHPRSSRRRGVGKARRRHGRITYGELFVKGGWISLQNGFPRRFNSISMV